MTGSPDVPRVPELEASAPPARDAAQGIADRARAALTLPDPVCVWETGRPELEAIQVEARRIKVPPEGVLAMAIVDSLLTIPYTVRYRSSLRPEGSVLNIMFALVGGSGTGKGGARAAARRAVQYIGSDLPDPATPRSGQAIAALFGYQEARKKSTDEEGQQAPVLHWWRADHAAYTHFDEVGEFSARGAGEGATLFATITAAVSGEQLGGQNAKGDGLTIPSGSYRMPITLGVQPRRAAPLLADGQVASGFAARIVWLPVQHPSAAGKARPTTPPEPVYVSLDHWTRVPYETDRATGGHVQFVDALPEMEAAHDADQDAAQLGIRDEINSRVLLFRAVIAIALANMAGRAVLIGEDWKISGGVLASSLDTLAGIRDELAVPEEDHRSTVEQRAIARMDTMRAEGLSFMDARRKLSNAQGKLLTSLIRENRFKSW